MMVAFRVALGDQQPVLDSLLERPAEAVGAVLVHRLEHGESGTDLEDGSTDEGGYAAAIVDFAWELGLGPVEGVPDEEAVYAPYY